MVVKRTGVVVLWVVVVGLVGSFSGAQRAAAGNPFFDDFSDMAHLDGEPVLWLPGGAGVTLDATSGDLLVTSAPPAAGAIAWGLIASTRRYQEVSVRTQVRLLAGQPGGALGSTVGVFARTLNQAGYAGAIKPDGELQIVSADGSGFPGGVTVLDSVASGLDVFSNDIRLRFDVFGDTLSLTAWTDGTPEPVTPQLTVVDTTYSDGTVGVVGQNLFASTTAFRFVEAVVPGFVPMLPPAGVALLGLLLLAVSLGALRYHS